MNAHTAQFARPTVWALMRVTLTDEAAWLLHLGGFVKTNGDYG